MIALLALLGCDPGCEEGTVERDGVCFPDVSGRGGDEPTEEDTGPPDDTDPPDTGDTADTADTTLPDLDDDGVPDASDCDDDDPTVFPGAEERCDYLDNDCDGDIDEEDATDAPTWYADVDGDRFGDPGAPLRSCVGIFGYVEDDQDCDDADGGVWPGALERCNDADDDCDGATDEPDAVDADVWYRDADADGFGDDDAPAPACEVPDGYVDVGEDCDDTDAAVNPATAEVPRDGVDNDCDGTSNGYGLDGERSLGDADAVHHGAEAGAYAGAALAVGDLDGDGADDLVVGAPFAGEGGPGAGVVYVAELGATGAWTLDDAPARRVGTASYDLAGVAVAVLDVDGDGAADLVGGSPGDDTGGADAGSVWWMAGPLTGAGAISGTRVPGDTASMGLGRALAGGDVDGDGDDEMLAGAGLEDGGGAGEVWLLDGDGSRLAAWDGEAAGDEAGRALAAGDLDGDGRADLVIGAPGASRGTGEVSVFLGGGTWTPTLDDADHLLTGDTAGDAAGAALAVVDLDGDGYGELLVGAPDASASKRLGGAVYVVRDLASGELPSVASAWFFGDEPGLHVGGSVAGGGDLDGDGTADLLVGAPESDAGGLDAGEAFVVFGPLDGALTWGGRLEGEDTYAYAGASVAFAVDPVGDGFDDVLVGAYGYARRGYAAGAVYRARGGSW